MVNRLSDDAHRLGDLIYHVRNVVVSELPTFGNDRLNAGICEAAWLGCPLTPEKQTFTEQSGAVISGPSFISASVSRNDVV